MVLVIVGRAPLGHAYHFPLISIRFGAAVDGFGCFRLVVLVVCGRAPWGFPYHFLRFPSDLLMFLVVMVVVA